MSIYAINTRTWVTIMLAGLYCHLRLAVYKVGPPRGKYPCLGLLGGGGEGEAAWGGGRGVFCNRI